MEARDCCSEVIAADVTDIRRAVESFCTDGFEMVGQAYAYQGWAIGCHFIGYCLDIGREAQNIYISAGKCPGLNFGNVVDFIVESHRLGTVISPE